jgi:lipoprotein-releasing system permease protein
MKRYEFFISFRYFLSRSREKLISVSAAISVLGIVIGVACLIVVLGVMTGFDRELKDKIIGANPHLVIQRHEGIGNPEELMASVGDVANVTGMSPFINGQAIVRSGDAVHGVLLRGIDPKGEITVTRLKDYLITPGYSLSDDEIIVGNELFGQMGLTFDQPLEVVSPVNRESYTYRVAGVFKSGMYEYDLNLIFTNLGQAKKIFQTRGNVSGIGIRLTDEYAAEKVKRIMRQRLGYAYRIRTWTDMNRNLFSALRLEKTVMFIILTLIVIVASLNIASALFMSVMDRTKDIGILKSIGVTDSGIVRIFMLQGLYIGLIGTGLGAGLGILISAVLKNYQFIKLPEDIYYIDKLPVQNNAGDIVLVASAAVLISLAATIYPALRASRLRPVQALRYE